MFTLTFFIHFFNLRYRQISGSISQLSATGLRSQHNTTQHNTAQHGTTQHNTAQHNTTRHNTTQHNTTQHNTAQHNTAQHGTTRHAHGTRTRTHTHTRYQIPKSLMINGLMINQYVPPFKHYPKTTMLNLVTEVCG